MALREVPPNFWIMLPAKNGKSHAINRVLLKTKLAAIEQTLLVNSSTANLERPRRKIEGCRFLCDVSPNSNRTS